MLKLYEDSRLIKQRIFSAWQTRFQYFPRLYRVLPLLTGQSPNGFFVFEPAWTIFFINTLTFLLVGHVVGSCWYLLGLQRVNQCLRDACHNSNLQSCGSLIDCCNAQSIPESTKWRENEEAAGCFNPEGDFSCGVYTPVVNLTTRDCMTKYLYSLFWGFQQISTLAGNQTPSYFNGEIVFTMVIIGLGLFFFALLIGNMQNFLRSLGRRKYDCMAYQVRQSELGILEVKVGIKHNMKLFKRPQDGSLAIYLSRAINKDNGNLRCSLLI